VRRSGSISQNHQIINPLPPLPASEVLALPSSTEKDIYNEGKKTRTVRVTEIIDRDSVI
jgi:hypothetical protein